MQEKSRNNGSNKPRGFGLNKADLWACLAIAFCCYLIFLPRIGSYGFWDPWEPKYSQSVREMFERGEIITPYYNGEIRYTKPILVYWAITIPAKIFGLSEFSARLASNTVATIGCLALYLAVSRLRNRRTGIMGALCLATMPQYFFLARMATTDIYLVALSGASAAFFILAFSVPPLRNKAFILAYLFVGLAVLAKGPIGILVPMLSVGVLTLWQWEPRIEWDRQLFKRALQYLPAAFATLGLAAVFAMVTLLAGAPTWWWYDELPHLFDAVRNGVLGITGAVQLETGDRMPVWAIVLGVLFSLSLACGTALIIIRFVRHKKLTCLRGQLLAVIKQVVVFLIVFLVVAGPWYGAVLAKHGGFWIKEFIGKHNIHRAGVEVNDHGGKMDYYVRALFFAIFPWIVLLPVSIFFLGPFWRKGSNLSGRAAGILALVWLVSIYAFYSYSTTKFYHYTAPALPLAALIIALGLDRLLDEAFEEHGAAWIATGIGLFALCLVQIGRYDWRFIVNMFTVKLAVPDDILNTRFVLWIYILWGLGAVLLLAGRSGGTVRKAAVVGMFAMALAFAYYCTSSFMPKLAAHKSLKAMVDTYESQKRGDEKIALFGKMKHGMVYYTNRQVVVLGSASEPFRDFMEGPERAFCVVQKKDMAAARSIMKSNSMVLHEVDVEPKHFDYFLVSNYGSALK
ncbi:ArnT family glycosyltransferase [Acidobacteriota bacterium]